MTDFFSPPPAPPSKLGMRRILSPNAGIRVSPLQLGAMSLGEAWKDFMGTMSYDQSTKLLDEFVAQGGNFIDTANNYQNEESEQFIGKWMAERGNRDQMVIATKFTSGYRGYAEGKNVAINAAGNSKKSLHMSVRDSLKKLQTDYIDLLYLHWWDYTTSIEEVMDSLHNLVVAGKVLYLGVSDTPAYIVSAANTYAKQAGKTPFVIYQGQWNVLERDMEIEILGMCKTFGLAIAPWDVIGGGRFKSKKQLEDLKTEGKELRAGWKPAEMTEEETKASEVLSSIAEEHGFESPSVIAIAYVMSKTVNVFPIIGGRKVEHLKQNIKALEVVLTPEQIKRIEDIRPLKMTFPGSFLGQSQAFTGNAGNLLGGTGNFEFNAKEKPPGY